jgi:hypothetical protein
MRGWISCVEVENTQKGKNIKLRMREGGNDENKWCARQKSFLHGNEFFSVVRLYLCECIPWKWCEIKHDYYSECM